MPSFRQFVLRPRPRISLDSQPGFCPHRKRYLRAFVPRDRNTHYRLYAGYCACTCQVTGTRAKLSAVAGPQILTDEAILRKMFDIPLIPFSLGGGKPLTAAFFEGEKKMPDEIQRVDRSAKRSIPL